MYRILNYNMTISESKLVQISPTFKRYFGDKSAAVCSSFVYVTCVAPDDKSYQGLLPLQRND